MIHEQACRTQQQASRHKQCIHKHHNMQSLTRLSVLERQRIRTSRICYALRYTQGRTHTDNGGALDCLVQHMYCIVRSMRSSSRRDLRRVEFQTTLLFTLLLADSAYSTVYCRGVLAIICSQALHRIRVQMVVNRRGFYGRPI